MRNLFKYFIIAIAAFIIAVLFLFVSSLRPQSLGGRPSDCYIGATNCDRVTKNNVMRKIKRNKPAIAVFVGSFLVLLLLSRRRNKAEISHKQSSIGNSNSK